MAEGVTTPSAAPAATGPPVDAPEVSKIEKRLVDAEARRQAGNAKFRAGEIAAAREEYEKALKLLQKDRLVDLEADDDSVLRAEKCRVPTLLNLALCCLKTGSPPSSGDAGRALELCEEVLEAEPNNPKATYRKGKALKELGDLAEAEYELVRACRLSPGDAEVRQELERVRQRMRVDKTQEKKFSKGVFERDPGFNSRDRATAAAQQAAKVKATAYEFLCDPAKNPFAEKPHPEAEAEARELSAKGCLEEAVWAWEAALQKSATSDWASHSGGWLELGRLFMDLNIDSLALRCLNKVAGVEAGADAPTVSDTAPMQVRANALLLLAVCLLNEAETDALSEVSAALTTWLDAVGAAPVPSQGDGAESLAERLANWRKAGGADAAVAQGVLHLLCGREEAVQAFADSLTAPADEGSCFGSASRIATRWNMLGAVLANRDQKQKAMVAYREALKLQQHYPRALTNLGIALQSTADPLGATRAYTSALELLPGWASPALWEMLQKAAQEHCGADGNVAEAAQQRSLARLRELLGPSPPSQDEQRPQASAAEVLVQIGLGI